MRDRQERISRLASRRFLWVHFWAARTLQYSRIRQEGSIENAGEGLEAESMEEGGGQPQVIIFEVVGSEGLGQSPPDLTKQQHIGPGRLVRLTKQNTKSSLAPGQSMNTQTGAVKARINS